MPEQLREALEQAGIERPETRREAMERAFDNLQEPESGSDRPAPGDRASNEATRRDRQTEQVVTPIAKTGVKSLVEEKPLAPLTKPAKADAKAAPAGKPAQVGKPAGEVKSDGAVKPSKAPVSWSPAEREHWDSISPEAKAAVLRREAEITRGLNESAAARRFGGEFYNIIKPFEHLIRSSGVTPLQAVDNLVKTAGVLQTGTDIQKAQTVANICAAYNINLQMLDQVLSGQQPKPGANGGQPNVDLNRVLEERLRPVNEFIREVRGGRAAADQALMEETSHEAEEFAANPANEFFEDLRGDIADLLDLAANRGRTMTLQQAYDLAASQHPEISQVVNQRKEAAAVAERAKNFDRSRRASSSQAPGTPGSVGGRQRANAGTNESRRDTIGRAWDDLSA